MTTTDSAHWYGVYTCPDCKGHGEKRDILGRWSDCRTCEGSARVSVDTDQILLAITTRKNTLYRSLPASARDTYGAEYVWRMARFHGGIDTSMPVMCFYSVGCHGILRDEAKAVLEILDRVSEAVARTYLGTDTAAVEQWGRALGLI